jgi:hypothetical protein
MDEIANLVHVYDKDGKMFGTGEYVSMKGDKTLVRFDGSTEKEFPTSQVKMVKEQDKKTEIKRIPHKNRPFNMGSSFPVEEPTKGYKMARELIASLRKEVYPKFNDDELEEFRNEMKDHLGLYLKEDKDTGSGLERIKFHFDKLFGPDLKFNINRDPNNPERDRIDVRGSQQDLADFGNELQGEKMEGYEVFWTDDDDRGQIVSIVKSDSIIREKKAPWHPDNDPIISKRQIKPGTYVGNPVIVHMVGPETEWKVEFIKTGKIVDYIDLMANLKFDDGTDYRDYLK